MLESSAQDVNGVKVVVGSLESVDAESLLAAAEHLTRVLGDPCVVLLGSVPDSTRVALVASASPQAVKSGINAGKLLGPVAKACGGGGGGKPNLAQAGGKQPEKLGEALEMARDSIRTALVSN